MEDPDRLAPLFVKQVGNHIEYMLKDAFITVLKYACKENTY